MPDIFVANNNHNNPLGTTAVANPLKNSDKKNPVHIFASYCEHPGDIKFRNQEQDEEVLLFVRKDFIVNFPWIVIGIILLILPLFFEPLINILNLQIEIITGKFLIFFTLFYYLIAATYIFINFVVWYFNVSFVTTLRIVDIDVEGIVYKNVAATKLNLVQDVNYTQTGVLRTIFDYGDVIAQTAGEMENFDFKAVPRPEDIVHIIGDLIGKRGRNV